MKPLRHKRRWAIAICSVVILLFLADCIAYPLLARPAGPSDNRGANGLWLSDRWYTAPATASDLAGLAQRLRANQIHYAYVHVGSVDRYGRLRAHNQGNAVRLVQALHALDPGVVVVAWVYAGNPRGRGRIDLADPPTRTAMAGEAAWLVKDCGFDGVQWDYEICSNGDQGFLALLKATRSALPAGKMVGVATPMWLPRLFRHWGWSDAHFGQVADQCDQIDVMAYDSGLWWPRGYAWLVSQQVAHVTHDVARANPHCIVLIGVPTYVAGGLSHDPRSENLKLSLIGVRNGLCLRQASPWAFAGVAVFADYTTTHTDWQTYARLWPLV